MNTSQEFFKIQPSGKEFFKIKPVFHGHSILTFNNTIGCAPCKYINKHKAFMKTGNLLSPQPY